MGEFGNFFYDTPVYKSHKCIPFEFIFGKLARLLSSMPLKTADLLPTYGNYIVGHVTRLNKLQEMSKEIMIKSKERNKKYNDKKCHEVTLNINDIIMLSMGGKIYKRSDQCNARYKIIEILPDHNIFIELSPNQSDTFHISHLKKKNSL